MVVPVILYGSPVLRKHSELVTDSDDIESITNMLSETLKKASGIGLAAPQINLLKRVFIIDTTPVAGDEMKTEKFTGVFINPEIIDSSTDISVYREGCLSIPEIYEEVKRPECIIARYMDSSLITREEELSGIVARIFQHEYDHLEGILFTDRISLLRKKLISGKLRQITKLARKSYDYYV